MSFTLSLRSAAQHDAEYLYWLADATMRPYVEATWGEWKEADVKSRIADDIAGGCLRLVYADDARVGTLQVRHPPECVQLDRIYIDPAFQRRGIGTRLIEDLIREAEAAGKPLRLRVLAVNPAKRLYDRLGFVVTASNDERYWMERP